MKITETTAIRAMLLLGVIVIGLQSIFAPADAGTEREALARIILELELLHPLLDEAKTVADRNARTHFRYDWVTNDLTKVRQGIREHINAPRAEPRSVPLLRGDYGR